MKRYLLLGLSALMLIVSCQEKQKVTTAQVSVALTYENAAFAVEGINVSVKETATGVVYDALTDAEGVASFVLSAGLYEASASYKVPAEGVQDIYNGLNTNIVVTAGVDETYPLNLSKSSASQIIIKELYNAGCTTAEGKSFVNDAYVILYNNSDQPADASKIGFAFATPFNSNSSSKYLVDGALSYEAEGWIPAGYSIWWFQCPVIIEPYSQILICISGCTDNTVTVPASVDLSGADYYMYNPESGYTNKSKYPAPPASMPVDHYLQTYLYAMGTAWPLSNTSPAFYIIRQAGIEEFTKDSNNYDTTENVKLPVVKVPMEWVVDAVEVYNQTTADKNGKRFPASIDAGCVEINPKNGYTAYRNVDKAATEALAENEGKLVYNYAGGTEDVEGTTDPSGIDAEASIANGAHIIYMDSNNSSNDFHQRKVASIKKK